VVSQCLNQSKKRLIFLSAVMEISHVLAALHHYFILVVRVHHKLKINITKHLLFHLEQYFASYLNHFFHFYNLYLNFNCFKYCILPFLFLLFCLSHLFHVQLALAILYVAHFNLVHWNFYIFYKI